MEKADIRESWHGPGRDLLNMNMLEYLLSSGVNLKSMSFIGVCVCQKLASWVCKISTEFKLTLQGYREKYVLSNSFTDV